MLIKCLYVCIAPLNHADVSIPIVLRRDSCEDKRRNPHAPPRVAMRGYAWRVGGLRIYGRFYALQVNPASVVASAGHHPMKSLHFDTT